MTSKLISATLRSRLLKASSDRSDRTVFAPWQLGTVTGVINFVRALASALMVALYGAILFGGMGETRGVTLESFAGQNAGAFTAHFRWIFAAAGLSLALSF